jgi:hypothetical protein
VVRLQSFELAGGCRRFLCKLSVNQVSVRFTRYIEYNEKKQPLMLMPGKTVRCISVGMKYCVVDKALVV